MKRTVIDEQLCRQVQLLLKGGAKVEEAAQITGTSTGTIGRIKKADYNIDRFNENKKAATKKETVELVYDATIAEEYRQEQARKGELPGQMKIELPAEETKSEMSDQTKMMRFQAQKFSELDTTMQQGLERIAQKLDRINDTISQILRVLRRE